MLAKPPTAEAAREPEVADDTAREILDALFENSKRYLSREPYAGIESSNAFNTKAVGTSFEGRQEIVGGLQAGQTVELVREPHNPVDPSAIAVRFGALQVGFLRKEIAKRLAPNIDAGERYEARISDVTGGRDGKHFGLNLYVRRLRPIVQAAERAAVTGAPDVSAIAQALIGDYPIRDAQRAVIDRVRDGANTLAVMGTGRGKSFCFQLPAAERALRERRKTLVFYPLRALANDQFSALTRRLAAFGLRILRANGGIDDDERVTLDAALSTGEWDMILLTPEFAEYHRDTFLRDCNRPSLVVIDEAHHLFESRHRPAYGTLPALIQALGAPTVLGLTATAGREAFAHVRRALGIERWVVDATVRENLEVVDARGGTTNARLAHIVDTMDAAGKAIVYCNSRSEATKLAERLRVPCTGSVAFYHAGVPTPERGEVERLFREGAVRAVVATSAFGEGIDLPDVRDVYLYHLNFNFTEFNQQAGRAGRDGKPARIHLLFDAGDRRLNEYIIDRSAPTLATLRSLYRGMRSLAADNVLRMTYEDVARTLELERVTGESVGAAVHIFEEAGLIATGRDDDGRFVRFDPNPQRVDLTQTTRYAEGEAEREAFARFSQLALDAQADVLQRIVNRPIYPDDVPLLR